MTEQMNEYGALEYPPGWALKRTYELAESDPLSLPDTTQGWARRCDMWRRSFARYIATHEPEPVDPLLIEAANMASNHAVWDTKDDYKAAKTLALVALKRGMELARGVTGPAG